MSSLEKMEQLRQSHYVCDDCWYSCPASGECCNDEVGDKCNCGADTHNAILDEALFGIKAMALQIEENEKRIAALSEHATALTERLVEAKREINKLSAGR